MSPRKLTDILYFTGQYVLNVCYSLGNRKHGNNKHRIIIGEIGYLLMYILD
jgi:hypothetical protein